MKNEFEIYATIKYTLMIGVILFAITSFIGITMLFLANDSILHTITGSANLVFAVFIAFITFKKLNNRKPEIVFNEIGIWLKGMEKLYPWALIERIDFKEYSNENEILYKNYLLIQFNNEDRTLTIPFDELDSSFEQIKSILNVFQKNDLINDEDFN